MDNVIWKPIPGYETLYEVSCAGEIRSIAYLCSKAKCVIPRKTLRLLRQETTIDGYKRVVLSVNGKHINTYPSTREAERQTGIACEQISRVCKGKNHHAGGFLWKYSTDNTHTNG